MFYSMVACQHNSFRPSLPKNTTFSPKFVKNQQFLWFLSPLVALIATPHTYFAHAELQKTCVHGWFIAATTVSRLRASKIANAKFDGNCHFFLAQKWGCLTSMGNDGTPHSYLVRAGLRKTCLRRG